MLNKIKKIVYAPFRWYDLIVSHSRNPFEEGVLIFVPATALFALIVFIINCFLKYVFYLYHSPAEEYIFVAGFYCFISKIVLPNISYLIVAVLLCYLFIWFRALYNFLRKKRNSLESGKKL
jgi:hypothetical protein